MTGSIRFVSLGLPTMPIIAFGSQISKFGPQFTNLTAVRWTQASPYHQFDNIVAEVPEPSSLATILAGTLGLVGLNRMRGRATARA